MPPAETDITRKTRDVTRRTRLAAHRSVVERFVSGEGAFAHDLDADEAPLELEALGAAPSQAELVGPGFGREQLVDVPLWSMT